jgi:hypothetical protein
MVTLFAVTIRARADENDCSDQPAKSYYSPQPGDSEGATHLSLARPFDGKGTLELDVCSGEARVKPSKDGQLHLEVAVKQRTPLKIDAYLQRVDVAPGRAVIKVKVPRKYQPEVVVEVPATADLHSEINLGAGDLRFYANGFGGQREVNLGAGNATIFLDGNHDYSHLEVNVGMGSFHDHRPGGGSAHLVISKDLQGTGAAPLQVNVGAGSLDLKEPE